MFKFIHAADIHLDSPLRGLACYESAPSESIRNASRRALENLVDLAIEESVAFVLLAGDLYDGDWKDYSTGIFLCKQMGRLGRENIPVFSVAGNHDAANRMTNALATPSNMTVFSSKKVQTERIDSLGVVIHGRSFGNQHESANLTIDFEKAEKGKFNIGLLHTSLDGREGHADYAPCSVGDLSAKGYQYWALGHVHKQEIVSEDPFIVFPGCLQGRHIKETGPKGCMLVSVEEGAVTELKKIPLDVIRWVCSEIDLSDVDEMQDLLRLVGQAIKEELDAANDRPIAMRIRFYGATKVTDMLSVYPERFMQQIKALGAEIAGDELWVERVENETTGKINFESILADESGMGNLLKDILAETTDLDEIDGLKEMLGDLREKIPSDAFGKDSELNLDEAQKVMHLIKEAKQMLVGRLIAEGGVK